MSFTTSTTTAQSTSDRAVRPVQTAPSTEARGLAATVATPLGDLVLVADDGALVEIRLPGPGQPMPRTPLPPRPFLPPLDRPTRNASGAQRTPMPPLDTPARRASGVAPAASGAGETGQTGGPADAGPRARADAAVLAAAERQLEEYFGGRRQAFDLPLRLRGTRFQRDVWEALLQVGYGATTSYSTIAERIGRPGAQRAVGAAVGSNPLAVIVPCHRIVGADGGLTGYGGGLPRKRYLLDLEKADRPQPA